MTPSPVRRMCELVEPIAVVTYLEDEPTSVLMALGQPGVWDACFAGRSAPLGRDAAELDQLIADLEPLASRLVEARQS